MGAGNGWLGIIYSCTVGHAAPGLRPRIASRTSHCALLERDRAEPHTRVLRMLITYLPRTSPLYAAATGVRGARAMHHAGGGGRLQGAMRERAVGPVT